MQAKFEDNPAVTSNFLCIVPGIGRLNAADIGELREAIIGVERPDGVMLSSGEFKATEREMSFVLNKRDPMIAILFRWREVAKAGKGYERSMTVAYNESDGEPTAVLEVGRCWPMEHAFPQLSRKNPEVALYKVKFSVYDLRPLFPQ